MGRSRHGPATVCGESRPIPEGSHWTPERAPGKAGPRRRSTSQETRPRSRIPTPFEAKGAVDACTARVAAGAVPGSAGASGRAGAENGGAGRGHGHEGGDPIGADPVSYTHLTLPTSDLV